MRIRGTKLVGAALLLVAWWMVLGGCHFVDAIKAISIAASASVRDAEYVGKKRSLPATATAKVTVKGGAVAAITLLEHSHGPGHGAEAILDRIIEKQSLMVDAVSGSTYSSTVVRKAVEPALKQGLQSTRASRVASA